MLQSEKEGIKKSFYPLLTNEKVGKISFSKPQNQEKKSVAGTIFAPSINGLKSIVGKKAKMHQSAIA